MALVRGIPFNRLPRVKRHAIFVAQRKQKATPAENEFCRYLAALGVSYRYQQGFFTPFYRIADFYLPDHNLIVEIDGPYHDADDDQVKDARFEAARGIRIFRLTKRGLRTRPLVQRWTSGGNRHHEVERDVDYGL